MGAKEGKKEKEREMRNVGKRRKERGRKRRWRRESKDGEREIAK